uniref:ABC transporter n=1 Tax=Streptomyces sp. CNQ-418 TaxID=467194 RepID=J7GY93_9ACTN|nr:ABC transporter [Streptomyces sp. CNQ-418]
MQTQAIQVRNLTVERGGREILKNIDFSIEAGSVTGLLGPSGTGKTTLIRCLVGLQKYQQGDVHVLGTPAGSASLRRQLGYLAQSPGVYADLTVRENVRHFAALHGRKKGDADDAIDNVSLTSAAQQFVRTLSGGQRTRAALACALVAKPKVLVLDEPTVGQDPVLRRELWNHFRSLAKEGTTLLVSSHVMDEAARCDQILLVRDGVVIANDTPDAIRKMTESDDLDEAFLRLVETSPETGAPSRVR